MSYARPIHLGAFVTWLWHFLLSLFFQVELSHFPGIIYNKVNGQVIPRPKVLYRFFRSFTGVLIMVWRYACCLDIILRLFLLLFCKLNLAVFRALSITKWMDRRNLMGATLTVLYRFFRNLTGVLIIVWRYACGLGIILRLFLLLFHKLNLAIFRHFYILIYMF